MSMNHCKGTCSLKRELMLPSHFFGEVVTDKGVDANEPLHGRTPPPRRLITHPSPIGKISTDLEFDMMVILKDGKKPMTQPRGPLPRVRGLRFVQGPPKGGGSRVWISHGLSCLCCKCLGCMDHDPRSTTKSAWTLNGMYQWNAHSLQGYLIKTALITFSKVHVEWSPNQTSTSYILPNECAQPQIWTWNRVYLFHIALLVLQHNHSYSSHFRHHNQLVLIVTLQATQIRMFSTMVCMFSSSFI